MSDISSPPERTEKLVERVALAIQPVLHKPLTVIARAALQSLGYAEMERVLLGLEAWFAGYVANGGKGADEELAMIAALRGDQEQGEG